MGPAAGEWMRDIVRVAFGSVDAETGKRFVGEIFNLVPKKNGKTTNEATLNEGVFVKARMDDVRLNRAGGTSTIFADAEFRKAQFRQSYFKGADFRSANLLTADFTNATCEECNFSEAKMVGTVLVNTNFAGSDMKGVNLYDALL